MCRWPREKSLDTDCAQPTGDVDLHSKFSVKCPARSRSSRWSSNIGQKSKAATSSDRFKDVSKEVGKPQSDDLPRNGMCKPQHAASPSNSVTLQAEWQSVSGKDPPRCSETVPFVDNDNDHSSSELSVHKTLTCPECQRAWSLAYSLFGESLASYRKDMPRLSCAGLVPLGMTWTWRQMVVVCFTHVNEFRWSTVCCFCWFVGCCSFAS